MYVFIKGITFLQSYRNKIYYTHAGKYNYQGVSPYVLFVVANGGTSWP
jgi:hypothetical protein